MVITLTDAIFLLFIIVVCFGLIQAGVSVEFMVTITTIAMAILFIYCLIEKYLDYKEQKRKEEK